MVLWCTKKVSHFDISNSDSSNCSEIEHSLIRSYFNIQWPPWDVAVAPFITHSGYHTWRKYIGIHWVSYTTHPFEIYISGDLKCLRQYRAGMKRGWPSEAGHRAPCTKPSPTQQVETSSAVCKLRSSSHSPGAKPQVMTQESEIGSMKSGWNLIDWIKLTEWYDEWVSNKWSYAWNWWYRHGHAKGGAPMGETPSLGMELGILRRGNQQTRLRLFGSMQVRCLPNREELCLIILS